MKNEQEEVKQFMIKAGQKTPQKPCIPDLDVINLRLRLHAEEAIIEMSEAFQSKNLTLIADAIADSLVVILGTAVACGIDIQPVWDEVHRSNMSKFIDGHKREDGKWIKGPSYIPANIGPLIEKQLDKGAAMEAFDRETKLIYQDLFLQGEL